MAESLTVPSAKRRRATVAAITAMMLIVLLGFAALGIDISWLAAAKHQLQASTDNCALATAEFIVNQPLATSRAEVSGLAERYGFEFMGMNPVEHIALIPDNIKTGIAVWDSKGRVVGMNPNRETYDAVRVIVTMSDEQSLPAFFGPIFGRDYYEPSAQAIALLSLNAGALLPFTIHIDDWNFQMGLERDQWKGDDLEKDPKKDVDGDGIPEIVLFPEQCVDIDTCVPCAGNFGALRVNRENLGLPGFSAQIEVGLTREDLLFELESQIGEYELDLGKLPWTSSAGSAYEFYVSDFLDGAGQAVNGVFLLGDPGLSVGRSMREALRIRAGDIVGVFIHDGCLAGGSNGTYHIIQIRYARLLAFKLSSGGKEIVIQPTEDEPSVEAAAEALGLGM